MTSIGGGTALPFGRVTSFNIAKKQGARQRVPGEYIPTHTYSS